VLSQLRELLATQIGPEDRLMLVTNDLGVRVRRPFSAGTADLEEDLKKISRLAAPGALQDMATRRILGRINEDGCRDDVIAEARAHAQGAYNEAALTLSNLQAFVESLAGLDARKAVLYVSDGLPVLAGDEVLRMLKDVCGDATSRIGLDLSHRLRSLTTAANAGRVTFYTLEARGLRNFTSSTVEYAQSFITPEMDFATTANLQDGLFNLADETGGRAVLDTNDLAPDLTRIAAELHSYYSLGYTPRHPGDGRVHDIRVEVKRDHLRVRHRSTYREASLEDRLRGRLMAALLHGAEENPLAVTMEVGPAEKQAKNRWLVPVRLRMPTDRLTLLPQGDVYEGQLRIVVGGRDAEGRTMPVRQVSVPLRVPGAEMAATARKPFVYELKLEMRSGEQTLAVGVQDEIARSGSFLVRGVRVDKGGVRLDPAARQ
jgi:VWFA-related protein